MPENLEYVQKGFRILHPMMASYIAQEMSREYKDQWWQEALNSLGDQGWDLPASGEWGDLVDSLDVANCLRLLDRQWGALFRKHLARDRRAWATELMGVRNTVAHAGSQDMPKEDAERALDTMARLCDDFDMQGADEIRALLRKLRYGSSDGSTAVTAANVAPQQTKEKSEVGVLTYISGSKLPSWRDIIEPHPDVAQGRYLNAEFAANLDDVARGGGAYEYRDPVEFFARTYIAQIMQQAFHNADLESTEILDELVRRFVEKIIVKRINTENDKTKKQKYCLEIWLFQAHDPVTYDLSLCERTHPSAQTKSVFLAEMVFTVRPSKIKVQWDRSLLVRAYLKIA